jgi:uncharacterized membrane protein
MTGAAFQGSDVDVTIRPMGRIVPMPAVFSFFNIVILAFAIAIVFDVLGQ